MTRLIAQERFYYIYYTVPDHVIAEIISSRLYSWLPFRIFYTIHVSVTRHFSFSKNPVFEDTVLISTIIFLYKLLSISKPNTFLKNTIKTSNP